VEREKQKTQSKEEETWVWETKVEGRRKRKNYGRKKGEQDREISSKRMNISRYKRT
jgi:hypothetical protein